MTFGERMALARRNALLSPEQLAASLGLSGPEWVLDVEAGRTLPDPMMVERVIRFLPHVWSKRWHSLVTH